MNITSTVFKNGETIPKKYTQFGEDINPPLQFLDVPEQAKSLVLIMDDPDVPDYAPVDVWDHWTVFNIPPNISMIPERWDVEGVRGVGTRNMKEYSGPKPPDREHRYFFKLYALDVMLDLQEGVTKAVVEKAMEGHIIEKVELIGLCKPQ